MPANEEFRRTASQARADVLAIAAHRDDVEQTCGGTLLRMAARGLRTAILDLTRGEAGSRGTAEDRGREAAEAAKLLGVSWREALDLPDGAIENTLENRKKIVRIMRELRPRVVILPYWQARHPDHAIVATLGYEACFLSGLAKIETGSEPFRPFKIVYASLYADVRPSFVVDITPFIEQRHAALMAYRSQYANQKAASSLFVAEDEIRERTFAEARHYGLLAGVKYGEPFVQKEVGLIDDLTLLPVQSI
jgi:N-acetylglucosamine malate deacetylase 1